MPPEMKGEVTLDLGDGRVFVLTMNHGTMFDAENAAKMPLPRLMAQAKLGFIGALRTFLFAALQQRHPDVTLEQASEITLGHLDKVDAALTRSFEIAFPAAAEGKDSAHPHAKAPRTGKRSGASGAKRVSTPKPSGKQRRARSG